MATPKNKRNRHLILETPILLMAEIDHRIRGFLKSPPDEFKDAHGHPDFGQFWSDLVTGYEAEGKEYPQASNNILDCLKDMAAIIQQCLLPTMSSSDLQPVSVTQRLTSMKISKEATAEIEEE